MHIEAGQSLGLV